MTTRVPPVCWLLLCGITLIAPTTQLPHLPKPCPSHPLLGEEKWEPTLAKGLVARHWSGILESNQGPLRYQHSAPTD